MVGRTVLVANVGDARAVLARETTQPSTPGALGTDQTCNPIDSKQTLNRTLQLLNPKSQNLNPTPSTLRPEPWTLDLQP